MGSGKGNIAGTDEGIKEVAVDIAEGLLCVLHLVDRPESLEKHRMSSPVFPPAESLEGDACLELSQKSQQLVPVGEGGEAAVQAALASPPNEAEQEPERACQRRCRALLSCLDLNSHSSATAACRSSMD